MKKLSLLSPEKIDHLAWFGMILIAIPAGLTLLNAGGHAALWENVHWTVATWVMVLLGISGWYHGSGPVKRVRGAFAMGMLSYAIGQVLWDIQWALGVTAFPAVSDVFYLGIAPFLIIGLILTVHNQVSHGEEVIVYLDSGMIIATLATGIFAFYGPRASEISGLSTLVLVSYPVVFLGIGAAAFVSVLSLRADYRFANTYLLVTGLGVSGICWILWNSLALDGAILPGRWVGYGFSLAHVWVGVGAAKWEIKPSTNPRIEQWNRLLIRTLPAIALPFAVIILVWGQEQTAQMGLPIMVGSVVVIALVVIRQSILVRERDFLLDREREALRRAENELVERQRTEEILLASEHLSRTLFATAQRQTQELALLDKIRTALAREFDLPTIFSTVVVSIADAFGYTHVSLYQLTGETLFLQHQVGYDQVIREVPITQGVSGEVARTGGPILLEDVRAHPSFLGAIDGIVSEVCVPLFDRGKVVGILNVESTQGVKLSDEDLNLMLALSSQVGIAIERSRLYTNIQRQNQILAALHETTLILMNRLELADVLEAIVIQAAQLARTDNGFLYLVEADGNRLKMEVGVGANAHHKGAYLLPGQGLAGKVWELGEPVVVQNYHLWEGKSNQFDEINFQAIAGVPLFSNAQIVGVFGVALLESGRTFDADVVDLLNRFAQLASITLENARLYTRVHQELTERRRAELESQGLLDIMHAAMVTADLQEFLYLVHQSIAQVISAENFFVALFDKSTGLFEEVYSVDKFDTPSLPYDLGKSASAYIFRTGKPLSLSQEQFLNLVAQGELELVGTISPSWLGVPLKTPEGTIGVMVVQDYEKANRYAEHEVDFLASIAGQVALAVDRKRTEEALRQFREVMDESNDAIFLIDPVTSKYIDFNQAAMEYLQYSREELTQLGVIEIAQHVSDLDNWQARVALVEKEAGLIFQTVYQRKDQSKFPVEVSARMMGYGDKTIMVAVVRDVTERTRVEEALSTSRETMRSLIQQLPVGIQVFNSEGLCIDVNQAHSDIFGVPRENLVERYNIFEDPFAESMKTQDAARRALNGETVFLGDLIFDFKNADSHFAGAQGQRILNVIILPIFGNDHQVIQFVGLNLDITERKHAEGEIKRRATEFAGLYEITRDLAIQWDLPRLLDTVATQAMELLHARGAGIYLYDPIRGDLPVAIDRGPNFLTDIRLALGEGIAGRVGQTRQSLIVDDYQTWEGRSLQYEGVPIRATAAVPMLYYGELIGVVVVEEMNESERKFTNEDVQFLSLLAAQAASAVHNARLFETTRRRLTELEAISKVSTALRTANTLDEMLPLLLEKTLALLDTDAGSIVLYDPVLGHLTPKVGLGWFLSLDQSPTKPDEGVTGYVFSTGEVYRSRDVAVDPRTRVSVRSQIPLNWSVVCLPLRAGQEIIGVMFAAVQYPRDFTDDEVRLLTTLAEIAGNAIHRSRLNEQTQRNLRRLAALHAIDLAITSSFDLNVSLNVLLEQAMFQLEADVAIVFRLNPLLHTLDYTAGRGLYTTIVSKLHLRLGDVYAGRSALERRLVSVPDLSVAEPLANPAFSTSEGIQAYHAVPLIAKGQVKGVLEVMHRKPFQPDPEWLNFLQTLGGQAAIALDNAELFTGLQHSNMELTLAYNATIEGWSRALDLRDKETEGHTQRVTETALRLAEVIGINPEELIHIRRGALLHDIGKMGVPDNILLKPGPLTPDEWLTMRRHPEFAYEMLAPIEYLHPALDIPYCHHEKWDGTGYPRGLKGEQIPLAARIFTIVDVWDALRSNRPYREAWPEEKVRDYLREQTGKYFDPQIVEAFLEMLNRDEVMK